MPIIHVFCSIVKTKSFDVSISFYAKQHKDTPFFSKDLIVAYFYSRFFW